VTYAGTTFRPVATSESGSVGRDLRADPAWSRGAGGPGMRDFGPVNLLRLGQGIGDAAKAERRAIVLIGPSARAITAQVAAYAEAYALRYGEPLAAQEQDTLTRRLETVKAALEPLASAGIDLVVVIEELGAAGLLTDGVRGDAVHAQLIAYGAQSGAPKAVLLSLDQLEELLAQGDRGREALAAVVRHKVQDVLRGSHEDEPEAVGASVSTRLSEVATTVQRREAETWARRLAKRQAVVARAAEALPTVSRALSGVGEAGAVRPVEQRMIPEDWAGKTVDDALFDLGFVHITVKDGSAAVEEGYWLQLTQTVSGQLVTVNDPAPTFPVQSGDVLKIFAGSTETGERGAVGAVEAKPIPEEWLGRGKTVEDALHDLHFINIIVRDGAVAPLPGYVVELERAGATETSPPLSTPVQPGDIVKLRRLGSDADSEGEAGAVRVVKNEAARALDVLLEHYLASLQRIPSDRVRHQVVTPASPGWSGVALRNLSHVGLAQPARARLRSADPDHYLLSTPMTKLIDQAVRLVGSLASPILLESVFDAVHSIDDAPLTSGAEQTRLLKARIQTALRQTQHFLSALAQLKMAGSAPHILDHLDVLTLVANWFFTPGAGLGQITDQVRAKIGPRVFESEHMHQLLEQLDRARRGEAGAVSSTDVLYAASEVVEQAPVDSTTDLEDHLRRLFEHLANANEEFAVSREELRITLATSLDSARLTEDLKEAADPSVASSAPQAAELLLAAADTDFSIRIAKVAETLRVPKERVTWITVNAIQPDRWLDRLSNAFVSSGSALPYLLQESIRIGVLPEVTSRYLLAQVVAHQPDPSRMRALAVEELIPSEALAYAPDQLTVRASLPSEQPVQVDQDEWAALQYRLRVIRAEAAIRRFNYRGSVWSYYAQSFTPVEIFLDGVTRGVDLFMRRQFPGGARTLRYVVSTGIGANEQYTRQLALLHNETDPAVRWIVVNSPGEWLQVRPSDATAENTVFVDISRSGDTQEILKTVEFTVQEFPVRIVLANRGPLYDGAKRRQDAGGPVHIQAIPSDIGGRLMRRQSPIVYLPMYLAQGSQALRAYVRATDAFDQALAFSRGRNSLAVALAEFALAQLLLGRRSELAVFATVGGQQSPLLYSAQELQQLWMEGAQKQGSLPAAMQVLALPDHSHKTLEGVLGQHGRYLALFLLAQRVLGVKGDLALDAQTASNPAHAGLTVNQVLHALATANAQRAAEVMPTITIELNQPTAETAAALATLHEDFAVYYTALTGQDPNSNPEVKRVRQLGNEQLSARAAEQGAVRQAEAVGIFPATLSLDGLTPQPLSSERGAVGEPVAVIEMDELDELLQAAATLAVLTENFADGTILSAPGADGARFIFDFSDAPSPQNGVYRELVAEIARKLTSLNALVSQQWEVEGPGVYSVTVKPDATAPTGEIIAEQLTEAFSETGAVQSTSDPSGERGAAAAQRKDDRDDLIDAAGLAAQVGRQAAEAMLVDAIVHDRGRQSRSVSERTVRFRIEGGPGGGVRDTRIVTVVNRAGRSLYNYLVKPTETIDPLWEINRSGAAARLRLGPRVIYAAVTDSVARRGQIVEEYYPGTAIQERGGQLGVRAGWQVGWAIAEKLFVMFDPRVAPGGQGIVHRFDNLGEHLRVIGSGNDLDVVLIDWGLSTGVRLENAEDRLRNLESRLHSLITTLHGSFREGVSAEAIASLAIRLKALADAQGTEERRLYDAAYEQAWAELAANQVLGERYQKLHATVDQIVRARTPLTSGTGERGAVSSPASTPLGLPSANAIPAIPPSRGAFLEHGWVIANHILVAFHAAFIGSAFSLPGGETFSRGGVLQFMFFSPETFVSLAFWALTYHVAVWWHERGHYWQAVKSLTLRADLLADAQAHSHGFARVVWELKMFVLAPLGRFPGIKRVSLNYYVEAPFNLAVAAAGPRASGQLGFSLLPLAITLIAAGLLMDMDLVIYAGRSIFGIGLVTLFDRFLADPGKYREFRDRERKAKEARAQITQAVAGSWRAEAPVVKERMRTRRLQEVQRSDGTWLKAPWGFRNSGMGGRHTEKQYPESNISMQEGMFIPLKATSQEEAQEMTVALQNRLKEIIESSDGARVMGIGLEGGLAPYIEPEEGEVPELRLWRMMKRAIEDLGYTPGRDVVIALDPATSELEDAYRHEFSQPDAVGQYLFWRSKAKTVMTREELLALYERALDEGIPIISIEDAFSENDWDGWTLLQRLKELLWRVGDDLVTTNDFWVEKAADTGAIDTLLTKANQIGTLTETTLAMLTALGKGLELVISHRSQSPNDDMEAQLALAVEAMGLKAGGGANTERLVKYQTITKLMREALQQAQAQGQLVPVDPQDEAALAALVRKLVITRVTAYEEPTNSGVPTVGIKISIGLPGSPAFANLLTFTGSTPLGTSAGTREAIHLVDSMIEPSRLTQQYPELFDAKPDGTFRFKKGVTVEALTAKGDAELTARFAQAQRYQGKGVQQAVRNVETILAPMLLGKSAADLGDLTAIDRQLLAAEVEAARAQGRPVTDPVTTAQRKGTLGMNAILSMSLALARFKAAAEGQELWQLVRAQVIEGMTKVIAEATIENGGPILSWQQLASTSTDFPALVASYQKAVDFFVREGTPLHQRLRRHLPVYEAVGAERGMVQDPSQGLLNAQWRLMASIRAFLDAKMSPTRTLLSNNGVRFEWAVPVEDASVGQAIRLLISQAQVAKDVTAITSGLQSPTGQQRIYSFTVNRETALLAAIDALIQSASERGTVITVATALVEDLDTSRRADLRRIQRARGQIRALVQAAADGSAANQLPEMPEREHFEDRMRQAGLDPADAVQRILVAHVVAAEWQAIRTRAKTLAAWLTAEAQDQEAAEEARTTSRRMIDLSINSFSERDEMAKRQKPYPAEAIQSGLAARFETVGLRWSNVGHQDALTEALTALRSAAPTAGERGAVTSNSYGFDFDAHDWLWQAFERHLQGQVQISIIPDPDLSSLTVTGPGSIVHVRYIPKIRKEDLPLVVIRVAPGGHERQEILDAVRNSSVEPSSAFRFEAGDAFEKALAAVTQELAGGAQPANATASLRVVSAQFLDDTWQEANVTFADGITRKMKVITWPVQSGDPATIGAFSAENFRPSTVVLAVLRAVETATRPQPKLVDAGLPGPETPVVEGDALFVVATDFERGAVGRLSEGEIWRVADLVDTLLVDAYGARDAIPAGIPDFNVVGEVSTFVTGGEMAALERTLDRLLAQPSERWPAWPQARARAVQALIELKLAYQTAGERGAVTTGPTVDEVFDFLSRFAAVTRALRKLDRAYVRLTVNPAGGGEVALLRAAELSPELLTQFDDLRDAFQRMHLTVTVTEGDPGEPVANLVFTVRIGTNDQWNILKRLAGERGAVRDERGSRMPLMSVGRLPADLLEEFAVTVSQIGAHEAVESVRTQAGNGSFTLKIILKEMGQRLNGQEPFRSQLDMLRERFTEQGLRVLIDRSAFRRDMDFTLNEVLADEIRALTRAAERGATFTEIRSGVVAGQLLFDLFYPGQARAVGNEQPLDVLAYASSAEYAKDPVGEQTPQPPAGFLTRLRNLGVGWQDPAARVALADAVRPLLTELSQDQQRYVQALLAGTKRWGGTPTRPEELAWLVSRSVSVYPKLQANESFLRSRLLQIQSGVQALHEALIEFRGYGIVEGMYDFELAGTTAFPLDGASVARLSALGESLGWWQRVSASFFGGGQAGRLRQINHRAIGISQGERGAVRLSAATLEALNSPREVAIIGAGGAGLNAAKALADQGVSVDVYERDLPEEFGGLIRGGVLGVHQGLKAGVLGARGQDWSTRVADELFASLHLSAAEGREIRALLTELAENPLVRFIGDVHVGRDLPTWMLFDRYLEVVFANGGQGSNPLTTADGEPVPGADLPEVWTALQASAWSNQYREGRTNHPPLPSGPEDHALVLGFSNSAGDAAFIAGQLVGYRNLTMAVRRGPEGLRMTGEQLADLDRWGLLVRLDTSNLEPGSEPDTYRQTRWYQQVLATSQAPGATKEQKSLPRRIDQLFGLYNTYQQFSPEEQGRKPVVTIRFYTTPVRIEPTSDGHVARAALAQKQLDGSMQQLTVPARWVISAIGQSNMEEALPGLPVNPQGSILTERFQIGDDPEVLIDPATRRPDPALFTVQGMPDAFVVGWSRAGRNFTGLYGPTKNEAKVAVEAAVLPAVRRRRSAGPTIAAVDVMERGRGVRLSFADRGVATHVVEPAVVRQVALRPDRRVAAITRTINGTARLQLAWADRSADELIGEPGQGGAAVVSDVADLRFSPDGTVLEYTAVFPTGERHPMALRVGAQPRGGIAERGAVRLSARQQQRRTAAMLDALKVDPALADLRGHLEQPEGISITTQYYLGRIGGRAAEDLRAEAERQRPVVFDLLPLELAHLLNGVDRYLEAERGAVENIVAQYEVTEEDLSGTRLRTVNDVLFDHFTTDGIRFHEGQAVLPAGLDVERTRADGTPRRQIPPYQETVEVGDVVAIVRYPQISPGAMQISRVIGRPEGWSNGAGASYRVAYIWWDPTVATLEESGRREVIVEWAKGQETGTESDPRMLTLRTHRAVSPEVLASEFSWQAGALIGGFTDDDRATLEAAVTRLGESAERGAVQLSSGDWQTVLEEITVPSGFPTQTPEEARQAFASRVPQLLKSSDRRLSFGLVLDTNEPGRAGFDVTERSVTGLSLFRGRGESFRGAMLNGELEVDDQGHPIQVTLAMPPVIAALGEAFAGAGLERDQARMVVAAEWAIRAARFLQGVFDAPVPIEIRVVLKPLDWSTVELAQPTTLQEVAALPLPSEASERGAVGRWRKLNPEEAAVAEELGELAYQVSLQASEDRLAELSWLTRRFSGGGTLQLTIPTDVSMASQAQALSGRAQQVGMRVITDNTRGGGQLRYQFVMESALFRAVRHAYTHAKVHGERGAVGSAAPLITTEDLERLGVHVVVDPAKTSLQVVTTTVRPQNRSTPSQVAVWLYLPSADVPGEEQVRRLLATPNLPATLRRELETLAQTRGGERGAVQAVSVRQQIQSLVTIFLDQVFDRFFGPEAGTWLTEWVPRIQPQTNQLIDALLAYVQGTQQLPEAQAAITQYNYDLTNTGLNPLNADLLAAWRPAVDDLLEALARLKSEVDTERGAIQNQPLESMVMRIIAYYPALEERRAEIAADVAAVSLGQLSRPDADRRFTQDYGIRQDLAYMWVSQILELNGERGAVQISDRGAMPHLLRILPSVGIPLEARQEAAGKLIERPEDIAQIVAEYFPQFPDLAEDLTDHFAMVQPLAALWPQRSSANERYTLAIALNAYMEDVQRKGSSDEITTEDLAQYFEQQWGLSVVDNEIGSLAVVLDRVRRLLQQGRIRDAQPAGISQAIEQVIRMHPWTERYFNPSWEGEPIVIDERMVRLYAASNQVLGRLFLDPSPSEGTVLAGRPTPGPLALHLALRQLLLRYPGYVRESQRTSFHRVLKAGEQITLTIEWMRRSGEHLQFRIGLRDQKGQRGYESVVWLAPASEMERQARAGALEIPALTDADFAQWQAAQVASAAPLPEGTVPEFIVGQVLEPVELVISEGQVRADAFLFAHPPALQEQIADALVAATVVRRMMPGYAGFALSVGKVRATLRLDDHVTVTGRVVEIMDRPSTLTKTGTIPLVRFELDVRRGDELVFTASPVLARTAGVERRPRDAATSTGERGAVMPDEELQQRVRDLVRETFDAFSGGARSFDAWLWREDAVGLISVGVKGDERLRDATLNQVSQWLTPATELRGELSADELARREVVLRTLRERVDALRQAGESGFVGSAGVTQWTEAFPSAFEHVVSADVAKQEVNVAAPRWVVVHSSVYTEASGLDALFIQQRVNEQVRTVLGEDGLVSEGGRAIRWALVADDATTPEQALAVQMAINKAAAGVGAPSLSFDLVLPTAAGDGNRLLGLLESAVPGSRLGSLVGPEAWVADLKQASAESQRVAGVIVEPSPRQDEVAAASSAIIAGLEVAATGDGRLSPALAGKLDIVEEAGLLHVKPQKVDGVLREEIGAYRTTVREALKPL